MEINKEGVVELFDQFQTYSKARRKFLSFLQKNFSCRDPLSEFSEVLVSRLMNASLAENRVQKGFDLIKPNGGHVQVKYLSNPNNNNWINWHTIEFIEDAEEYALVIFVALKLKAVIVFQRETIGQVCKFLRKRHPNQDTTLQFTKRNFEMMMANIEEYANIGVEIFQY